MIYHSEYTWLVWIGTNAVYGAMTAINTTVHVNVTEVLHNDDHPTQQHSLQSKKARGDIAYRCFRIV